MKIFLRVLALIIDIVIISILISGCKKNDTLQPNVSVNYETDYLDITPQKVIFYELSEQIGNINDFIEKSPLIAEIKILGLSNFYMDEWQPLSVYAGEIVEVFKGDCTQGEIVYISRYGTPEYRVHEMDLLKPGDNMVLFLKHDDLNTECIERPLLCGCYSGFFDNLYIYEENNRKYILPNTLEDFFPQDLMCLQDEIAQEINTSSSVYRRANKKVYDYDTVINYIKKEINK